jgi:hypothetical protein
MLRLKRLLKQAIRSKDIKVRHWCYMPQFGELHFPLSTVWKDDMRSIRMNQTLISVAVAVVLL